ncbi:DUF5686 family protein [Dyadobacter sp. 676]|uniref:DUF5686 family protein n=1 Tax=Dyadobacter sp. 676 TaxID=3088362 RepID=A0AAU8FDN6_9BACT
MDYFKRLLELLKIEREEDKQSYQRLIERSSVSERRANGLAWYPIAIRGQEMSRGDYLTVEVERTTHQDVPHQLRFGMPAVLFSNHEPQKDRVEGVISHQSGNRLKITLRTDELPEWSRDGKLGIDLLFDDNSYDEMQSALKTADSLVSSDKEGHLIKVLTGQIAPSLEEDIYPVDIPKLNPSQQRAVRNILSARELAIVHGPPGTGKTTTLVQAIKALVKKDKRPVLVVAPSNTEANFKKGVPMLNETVSEVTFRQPNVYKQRVIATRSSMDKNMADPNMYLLASFYQPEVVKAVSPLSPRAFAYYKFEYLGAFRENGIEVNKIKVTPRNWGEGVYRGTIQIIEGEWSIYSLDLQTVNTGFRIDIKQVYSPVQGVWMPVNQQFHVQGGIYGFKGKGDFVISQSFTNVKINPAFKPDIVVIDDKKYAEEAKKVRLSGREIRTQRMEEVVSRQKEFSAKNLRKMMKEYEKQDLKEKKKKGEDIDLKMSRQDSTQIDSMANKRSMAFWDSLRTVPLTVAEVKSYTRLDSLVIINEGSEKQKDSLKTSKRDTTKAKKGSHFSFGDLLTGHHFRLGKESPFRLDYTGPLPGVQVNTVEGLVLNGAGLKLRHSGGSRGGCW